MRSAARSMHRIIIDANIIVSAVFGVIPRRAVVKAYGHTVLYPDKIELELKLLSGKLIHKLAVANIIELSNLIRELLLKGEFVKTKQRIDIGRDKKDNHYLDLACYSNADILVTGDKDLLEIPKKNLIKAGLKELAIINPKEFINLVNQMDGSND